MKKSVAIFGGGPAAMMLASSLDQDKFTVTIYEKNKALGRKFLVAGKGGFNLTHGESIDALKSRYLPNDFLSYALEDFSNSDLVSWLNSRGIATFVGSSNRVFPVKGIKPIQVLKTILAHLSKKGVHIEYENEWVGWDENGNSLLSNHSKVKADYCVFALGGASWSVTGSTGNWKEIFEDNGIKVNSFQASNCAVKIQWNDRVLHQLEGKPLKNIALSCGGITKIGEVVLTQFGLEGSGIYALSAPIRTGLNKNGEVNIYLDLKPMWSLEKIHSKLEAIGSKNITR